MKETPKRIFELTVPEFIELVKNIEGKPIQSEETEIWDMATLMANINKTRATCYKYISRGEFPSFKKGNSRYFLKSDVVAWIKENKAAK